MRILFIGPNRVGDAVLATGLLDHLIRTHPDARISVACGRPALGVFARMPGCERILPIDKRRWDLHWVTLWLWAVRRRWDLVLDIRGSALGYMVRSRRRAVMRPRPGHKIAQLGAVLRLDPPPAPVAWIAPADHARARSLLGTDRPLVALGPTANWKPKTWPAESFAALFRALAAGPLPGAIPVVLGGPGEQERALAAPLLALLPEAIDLCGRLTLPEAAACLTRARLFIGNDSGLMHLAAAAGAPTIGIFGPTDAATYAPIGARAVAVTGPNEDIGQVAVAEVRAAAERLLAAHAPPETAVAG
ncbi:MAG: glycosyltransferase family 9 protein [Rhodospirillales bacterium]|nr:glycosyltransferase family 9 protein [Rhodospirillales bacterium]